MATMLVALVAALTLTAPPASGSSNTVATATRPDAPGSLTVTPGRSRVDLSWTTPADNGAAITSYDIQVVPSAGSSEGHLTDRKPPAGAVEGDPVSATIPRLRNGATYTIYVSAINAAGPSDFAIVSGITPQGVPDAPASVRTTTGDGSVAVTWSAPADGGGSPVTGYAVTLTPPDSGAPQTQRVGPGVTTAAFSGLTNATSYALAVVASNALGDGAAATTVATPASAPGPVTHVSTTRANRGATVRWVAPSVDGGSPITGYRVTASPGGVTRSVTASARSMVFPGLTNGTRYTFRVAAANAKGYGAPSAASAAVVPAGPPGQTAKPAASAGKGFASVSWRAPAANGSAITRFYVYCSNRTTRTVSGSVRSVRFAGVQKGTRLVFRVRAVSAAGTGAPSVRSNVVTVK